MSDASLIDSLVVEWPSGAVDRLSNLHPDTVLTVTEGETVSVDDPGSDIPRQIRLFQNFPNPFNPSTVIRFELSEARHVRIDLFDILGRHVGNLVNEARGAGMHSVHLSAAALPSSGPYTYRLTAGRSVETRKLLYLK